MVVVLRWTDCRRNEHDSCDSQCRQWKKISKFETVIVEHPQEHTVLVTLNRPERENAMEYGDGA